MMKTIKGCLIGFTSMALSLSTANCLADAVQDYTALAAKLATCTPVSMDVPDPILAGTDTWVITGANQGNCQFSQSAKVNVMNVKETVDCSIPMQEMQSFADQLISIIKKPNMNSNNGSIQALLAKSCKKV